MTKTNFDRFDFRPFIIQGVEKLGFKQPTEIQERLIPSLLKGESAIGQSQTGTGKTHAYLLPLLQNVDPTQQEVQVIITAPTRELASQIYKEVVKITNFCEPDAPITAKCFIGGTDKQRTIEKLKTQPQIVVGTPGRIADLVYDQALFIHNAKALVVDEADLMLDMGFIQDVDRIGAKMPEQIQMLVFSATIPEKLKPFLKKYLENPKYTHVAPKRATAEKIEHVLVPERHRNKVNLLQDILLSYNPYLAIVFTNTKKKAEEVARGLEAKGMRVGRIHGDLSPRERKKMMKQITDLEFQYVVATDLAARGIDIEGVSHVINYELPSDLDFYIHRVGRTARAGYSGIATTIFSSSDEDAIARLEKMDIQFVNRDIQNGQWTNIEDRNRRKNRKKKVDEADLTARKLIKKPKKVKPGYKKKREHEIEKYVKKQKRSTRNK
ncbi:DEAD/DEAH box helicase [Priestia koreensis]|uniref:DEAD/DEAH box helicase n=1 Tax=Priestia koreensis TaxID=284581 RepID=UPI00203A6F7F|nr:DEAD/DEAH box helicase [Priestia koreensis]MCM3002510.1 DEAD/DEAH box helicase [Priestia koreensis]